jgi:DnaJ-class molecular chaperone
MLVFRSRTYHPDRAGSAHERTFILIRLAYETLSDPVKRYAYDR